MPLFLENLSSAHILLLSHKAFANYTKLQHHKNQACTKKYNRAYGMMLICMRTQAVATNQDFLVIRKSHILPYCYSSVWRTHGTVAEWSVCHHSSHSTLLVCHMPPLFHLPHNFTNSTKWLPFCVHEWRKSGMSKESHEQNGHRCIQNCSSP